MAMPPIIQWSRQNLCFWTHVTPMAIVHLFFLSFSLSFLLFLFTLLSSSLSSVLECWFWNHAKTSFGIVLSGFGIVLFGFGILVLESCVLVLESAVQFWNRSVVLESWFWNLTPVLESWFWNHVKTSFGIELPSFGIVFSGFGILVLESCVLGFGI
jgi:hypothetical protein